MAIKPFKLFVIFVAFLLTITFYLLPGLHGIGGLPWFTGEKSRKDGDQYPLRPPPKVDLISGIPAIGFGTWRASPSVASFISATLGSICKIWNLIKGLNANISH